jgi:hypothetical protein
MYNKFKFKSFCAHYITSSPTSANGDVMFYFNKNRESVFLNQTSSNLLPFVISDPHTILGPQWQNMTAKFTPTTEWKSCDYGMDATLQEYADGDIFLLSRTSTTDSPGYVIFDYEIEFREKSINPRLLTLPITRIQWSQAALQVSGVVTSGAVYSLSIGGNNLSGSASTLPSGATNGDIYKIIIDLTNSTLTAGGTAITTSNVPEHSSGSAGITFSDGTTLYANYNGSSFALYPNVDSAFTNSRQLVTSSATTVNITLQVWLSYLGSVAGINVNPNF